MGDTHDPYTKTVATRELAELMLAGTPLAALVSGLLCRSSTPRRAAACGCSSASAATCSAGLGPGAVCVDLDAEECADPASGAPTPRAACARPRRPRRPGGPARRPPRPRRCAPTCRPASAATPQRARGLLTPLAFALGAGLPWEDLWAALASELAATAYTDEDLVWLRRTAGSYVVEAAEAGGSVYRLYHEALAEHLRHGHDPGRVHAATAGFLTAHTPEVGSLWSINVSGVTVMTASACSRRAASTDVPAWSWQRQTATE
jgi:hypothetical protein